MIDNEKIAIDYAGVYDFTQMKFDRFYVDVVVFSNKEHHDDYLRSLNISEDEIEHSWASWHMYAYRINQMGLRTIGQDHLGRISLILGSINVEVFSHEVQHMVNQWVTMDYYDLEKYDEHIATMVGRFYKKFYEWFYTVGLDKV